MISVGLIRNDIHDDEIRYKSDRHHSIGLFSNNATLAKQKKLKFLCPFMLTRKKHLNFQFGHF